MPTESERAGELRPRYERVGRGFYVGRQCRARVFPAQSPLLRRRGFRFNGEVYFLHWDVHHRGGWFKTEEAALAAAHQWLDEVAADFPGSLVSKHHFDGRPT